MVSGQPSRDPPLACEGCPLFATLAPMSKSPGLVLSEHLKHHGISQSALARHWNVAPSYITSLIKGETRITPKVAWRIADTLAMDPAFWLGLQAKHDITLTEPDEHLPPLTRGH